MVSSDKDIAVVVGLIVGETFFQEVLGRELDKNSEDKSTDLFWRGTAALANSVLIQNYLR